MKIVKIKTLRYGAHFKFLENDCIYVRDKYISKGQRYSFYALNDPNNHDAVKGNTYVKIVPTSTDVLA